jgi:DNA sulfur modification protein DndD
MIFDSLTIENFGAYAGAQQMTLSPLPGKPVVLVGGMNGGGKTTLLDAVQLVLYGSRARASTRGRESYHDFLRSCINRNVKPEVGAKITLNFSRFSSGKTIACEVQRAWRETSRGIVETLMVTEGDDYDATLTEHWDEFIEGYLPSRIAHLFFFDGEQIKELAERENAAGILGTAIHSLLGLDVVDRLQADLKVLERRKRAEVLDGKAAEDFSRAQLELKSIEALQAEVCATRASLENVVGRLAKDANTARERFRSAGGEAYQRRADVEKELVGLRTQEAAVSEKLRELLASHLPLAMVTAELEVAEASARVEAESHVASEVLAVIKARDAALLKELKRKKADDEAVDVVASFLRGDRRSREQQVGSVSRVYPTETVPSLAHAREIILPAAIAEARAAVLEHQSLNTRIGGLERALEAVPDADALADIQKQLDLAEGELKQRRAELEALVLKQEAFSVQRAEAERRLERSADAAVDQEQHQDSRDRVLTHSTRVRKTLEVFRNRVVQRHVARLEALILDSLQQLLRKRALADRIAINPETYTVTLLNAAGQTIPFERLSAGERQLLATALLWGLARASGRPVPTIIDTPLGRLDSSHRKHLVRGYFPRASHQVILLSTDEEIIGTRLTELHPSVARVYRLAHDDQVGETSIEEGYFEEQHAAT